VIDLAAYLNRALPELFLTSPSQLAVACSGGADSLALACLLHDWGTRHAVSVTALICNHGLRPTSAAEADQTRRALAARGIDTALLSLVLHEGPALQARARDARYAAMAHWCQHHEVKHLFTAHHADDQMETFLFRLLRHSGPLGLAGMSAVHSLGGVHHVRPLLAIRKASLVDYLRNASIQWVEDPSNQNPRFTRVRIRRWLAHQPETTHQRLQAVIRRYGEHRIAVESAMRDLMTQRVGVTPERLHLPADLLAHPLATEILQRCLMHLGGGRTPPRGPELARLLAHLQSGNTDKRTLHHCQLQPRGDGWDITPQPGLEATSGLSHIKGVENPQPLLHATRAYPLLPERFVLPVEA